jgi:hypothetical protein
MVTRTFPDASRSKVGTWRGGATAGVNFSRNDGSANENEGNAALRASSVASMRQTFCERGRNDLR